MPEKKDSPATPFFRQVLEQKHIDLTTNSQGILTLTLAERYRFKEEILGNAEKINYFFRDVTNEIFGTRTDRSTSLNITASLQEFQREYKDPRGTSITFTSAQEMQAHAALAVIWNEILKDIIYIRNNRGENFKLRTDIKNVPSIQTQSQVIDLRWKKVHIPEILNALTVREDDAKLYWTMDFPVKDFVYYHLQKIEDFFSWLAMATNGDMAILSILQGIEGHGGIREMLSPKEHGDMPPQTYNQVDTGLKASLPKRNYRGTGGAPAPRVTKGTGSWYYSLDYYGFFFTERQPKTPPLQVANPLKRLRIEEDVPSSEDNKE